MISKEWEDKTAIKANLASYNSSFYVLQLNNNNYLRCVRLIKKVIELPNTILDFIWLVELCDFLP
jgi:hypothetical protein